MVSYRSEMQSIDSRRLVSRAKYNPVFVERFGTEAMRLTITTIVLFFLETNMQMHTSWPLPKLIVSDDGEMKLLHRLYHEGHFTRADLEALLDWAKGDKRDTSLRVYAVLLAFLEEEEVRELAPPHEFEPQGEGWDLLEASHGWCARPGSAWVVRNASIESTHPSFVNAHTGEEIDVLPPVPDTSAIRVLPDYPLECKRCGQLKGLAPHF